MESITTSNFLVVAGSKTTIKHLICPDCGWSDMAVEIKTGQAHCWRCGNDEDYEEHVVQSLLDTRSKEYLHHHPGASLEDVVRGILS